MTIEYCVNHSIKGIEYRKECTFMSHEGKPNMIEFNERDLVSRSCFRGNGGKSIHIRMDKIKESIGGSRTFIKTRSCKFYKVSATASRNILI